MTTDLVELKSQSRALSHGVLNPANLHEAMEMAGFLCKSTLIPKDFQGNPGNVLVAIQWGMELGMAPMQALQSIAVINGRPSMWGDAVIALCKAHPICEWVKEIEEEETAVCIAQRRGDPEPVERRFSMEDAKRAGLLGKPGPWSQYPRRMLQMRARSWCLRDAFPDLLRGMAVAEEQQDRPDTHLIPSNSGGFKPASRTEAVKQRLKSGTDTDTDTPPADPLADLLMLISEAQTVDELEQHRDAVAGLKNGQKARAIAAWKARKAVLAGAESPMMARNAT
jgi:hypothetical protein